MSPQEIIAKDCERTGHRVGAVMHGIAVAFDKRGAKLFHDGKSVVILEPIGQSKMDFEVHLFTVDSPLGIVRSVRRIGDQIRQVPSLEKVYGDAEPQVVQMLRTAGFPVENSDRKEFNWMARA